MTLQRYLTRLILLCVLPLAVLAVVLAAWHVSEAQEDDRAEAQRLASSLAATLDQGLRARMAGLQTLAMSPLADDPARWSELHREAQGFVAGYGSHVAVIDGAMRPLLHTRVPFGDALPALPHARVQSAVLAALASATPVVSDPFVGAVSKESSVAIVVPGARGGRLQFVVINSLPSRELAGRLEQLALPQGWRVRLADSRGETIAGRGDVEPGPADEGWNFTGKLAASPWSVQVQVPQAVRWQRLGPIAADLAIAVLGATAVAVLGGILASRRLARSVRSLADPAAAPGGPTIAEIGQARQLLDQANDRLAVRESQLRGIVESATEAIVTADESQTIVMANPAAARIFGRPIEELVGRDVAQLIPSRHREQHRRDVEAFGRGPLRSRPMGTLGDVTGLRADGSEFPMEAAISHVHVDGQRLFTVILRDVTERRRAEAALRASKAALEASHGELERLVAAQQSIEENERKRIARELHDELQQVLAAIKMDAGAIAHVALADPRRIPPLAARIDELASAAITSTRRIVNDLRPLLLEELGLVAALETLSAQFTRRTGIRCQVVTRGLAVADDALPSPAAICLYRVAQESLNNVAKHAGAQQVDIGLEGLADGSVVLRVSDDGRGIAPQDGRKPRSFGLRGMHERVRALGGTLRVEAREDRSGTVVQVSLPLHPGATDDTG